MSGKKLKAEQARRLLASDQRVKALRRALDDAETEDKELRQRYLPLVPLSEDAEERAKGVRTCVVAGIKFRVTPQISGDYFNLSGYKKDGHTVTAKMLEHIKPGKAYDRWTVNGPPQTEAPK